MLTQLLFKKLKEEMRIIHFVKNRPNTQVKLDPLDPEELNIDLALVSHWSPDNQQLYQLLLDNGMATFICNQRFIFDFYTVLKFSFTALQKIDQSANRFANLTVLSLLKNNIQTIENIPEKLKELYLDFNYIDSIHLHQKVSLQLLSVSHNLVDDQCLGSVCNKMPELRCLNVSYNRISDIRSFVLSVSICQHIKILASNNNSISLLRIYWDYITSELELRYFDNEKYVKPEPLKKEEPKVQIKEQPVKDDKKGGKKDAKKPGKVEEKPPEPVPPKEELKEEPVELTEEDFTIIKLSININQFQGFQGNQYDTSLFPQENLDVKKTQTSYYLKYRLMEESVNLYDKRIALDSVTVDGTDKRLDFAHEINSQLKATEVDRKKFDQGLYLEVLAEDPIMLTDPESQEQKPDLKEGQIQSQCRTIGAVFVDLRNFHSVKKKESKLRYRLFDQKAVYHPHFVNPLENEQQLIEQNREKYEQELREKEQALLKQKEAEEAAKLQKKGGKDNKKATDKKAAKKEGKQPAGDKKTVTEKCAFEMEPREYCYLGQKKMHKAMNQTLAISIMIG